MPIDLKFCQRAAYYKIRKGQAVEVLNLRISREEILANDTAAKNQVDTRLIEEWQTRWDRSSTGRTTHEFFPSIARRLVYNIELDYYVTQFLTGHGGFAYYLHKFNARNFTQDSDLCDCGQTETADHILFGCPLLRRKRRRLVKAAVEITGEWPCAKENLVSDMRIFKEFRKFAKWYILWSHR
ncbi:unnamed protein product [Trichogramma brassicae]|uniref:Reverse transcriptase zinc-binding domain-containing protein n=1 Tax=Trichogramma brassicae TaxID=86971 RepID=A0A6H5IUW5_9HYME|nr:unnamed protein product [Trichogramma brassicae]